MPPSDQFGLIATVLLLAGLPLLARRFFGPVSDGRAARFLRVAGYAAILALMPARAVVGPYPLTVPQRGPAYSVFHRQPETYPRDARGARPVGRRAALAGRDRVPGPDGLLRGRPPLGDLAAVLGGPGHAGRRHRRGPAVRPGHVRRWPRSDSPSTPPIRGCRDGGSIRSWRSRGSCCSAARWRPAVLAARRCRELAGRRSRPRPGSARASSPGCSRTWSGALFVTVLGTGTTALTAQVAWLRHWLYHGPHRARPPPTAMCSTPANNVERYVVI